MRKRIYLLSSIILIGMFLAISCKDNPSSFNENPPSIPPSHSMEMDFSTFDNEGDQQTNQIAADSTSNFNNAAIRAFVMKLVVEINLAIPRTLLEAASKSDAELNEDEKWEWTYTKSTEEHTYEVRLVASRFGEDQVNWEFYITNTELGITDYLFFEGITHNNGSDGNWTYYDLQNNSQEPVSVVDWEVNGEVDVYLKLEVLSDRNDNLGDYIEYTFDGTVKHAVYHNTGEDTNTEIQWNVETHEGFLIAPDYSNGEKACWNSDLVNTPCG